MLRLSVPKYFLLLPLMVALVGGTLYFKNSGGPNYITAEVKRADLTREVLASGSVESPKNIDLQFQNSGKLIALNVESGDTASAGEVLASLDISVLGAQRAQAASILDAQKAQLANLKAGTRPEQIAVTQSQIASAETSIEQTKQASVDAINNAYSVADSAIKNSIDPFLNNAQTNPTLSFLVTDPHTKSTLEAGRSQIGLTLALWQQSIATLLSKGDVAGAESAAQLGLQQSADILGYANDALSSAITSSQTPASQITAWMASVATSRTAVHAAIATVTAASTARKSALAALDSAQKNLSLEQAGSTSATVAAQEAQVEAAQASVAALDAQIAQMRIVAPLQGTITKVNVELGETVTPGLVAISMIPDSKLQVDVNLSEDNVAYAKVGDPARITLDAFANGETWQGTVVKIDPAQTIIGGAVYYKTTVNFNEPDDRIKPGMTANIWIQTGAAASALVVPASALSNDASGTHVQVLENGTPKSVPVTVGLKNRDGMVQILTGLEAGQKVVTGQ